MYIFSSKVQRTLASLLIKEAKLQQSLRVI